MRKVGRGRGRGRGRATEQQELEIRLPWVPFDARIAPFFHFFLPVRCFQRAHQEFRIAARSHGPFGEDELAMVTIQPPPTGSPKDRLGI